MLLNSLSVCKKDCNEKGSFSGCTMHAQCSFDLDWVFKPFENETLYLPKASDACLVGWWGSCMLIAYALIGMLEVC